MLDESLEESFPASDPLPVDPGVKKVARRAKPRSAIGARISR